MNKVRTYAEAVYETVADKYAKRGQHNKEKIIQDHYQGKLAEFTVKAYFKGLGDTITEPDLNIYPSHLKSFEGDLKLNNHYNLHVKNINKESAARYGVSFMCQKEDDCPGIYDIYVLVVDGEIVAFIPRIYAVWEEPKLEKLKKTKKTLYLDDQTHYLTLKGNPGDVPRFDLMKCPYCEMPCWNPKCSWK